MSINEEASRPAEFATLLLQDVIAARRRLEEDPSQTSRRDVVRTTLAAIEGWTWLAREHVRRALADLDELDPKADMALREISYFVTEKGELKERYQGLSLPVVIKLIAEQARIICPELTISYSVEGWAHFRDAISIRNRITHPKPDQHLTISDLDLAAVSSGFTWALATLDYVMTSTNLALAEFNDGLRELFERLQAGDPETLAEYHATLRNQASAID